MRGIEKSNNDFHNKDFDLESIDRIEYQIRKIDVKTKDVNDQFWNLNISNKENINLNEYDTQRTKYELKSDLDNDWAQNLDSCLFIEPKSNKQTIMNKK